MIYTQADLDGLDKDLASRYRRFKPIPQQQAFWNSRKRFNVTVAGRRSGKTEIGKRKLVRRVMTAPFAGIYLAGAPTYQQARRIFWADLKRLTRPFAVGLPSESDMAIYLMNGSTIIVGGLDVPERFEGIAFGGVHLDEYANCKREAWEEHISPMLDDVSLPRPGWAMFTGVPEGRNHFYDLFLKAQDPANARLWDSFRWSSRDVLSERAIQDALGRMDPRTAAQELDASFETLSGRIYYPFDQRLHLDPHVEYDPNLPLLLAFDFNVDPGVAVIAQARPYDGPRAEVLKRPSGEEYVPRKHDVINVLDEIRIMDSNTVMVAKAILERWKERHHGKKVICFGDASGGARGSAKVSGSDWQLIKATLSGVDTFGPWSKQLVSFRVPKANPPEKARVNAVNRMLLDGLGRTRVRISPACQWLVRDLEGVKAVEGSSGEIDKKDDKLLTHISDAFGYLIHRMFPIEGGTGVSIAPI